MISDQAENRIVACGLALVLVRAVLAPVMPVPIAPVPIALGRLAPLPMAARPTIPGLIRRLPCKAWLFTDMSRPRYETMTCASVF